ncbi:MAG: DUF4198 domain-containing protein [Acidobacteria bacterium]|nr:DUF4198 domain-containing protein [Acidobacteriota bacterium]MCA1651668.1 DUF4198 domain-containing protein [Acidobacteriota bacterium]
MFNTTSKAEKLSSGLVSRAIALLSCFMVAGAPLLAHDLWIEPSSFLVDAGKLLGVRLRVGQDLVGDPVPRDPALIDRFISVDRESTKPIPGADGVDPAGLLRVTTPGIVILGYSSKPTSVVLPARKFNDYLAEEGLETVAALRTERNETNADAREAFARCAKALLSVGPANATQVDRALGFTLELVAERNPYTLRQGQELPVRLIYQNKPLGGALIVAINRRNPSAKLSVRSGNDGRATFRLAEPGMWLIKAVHMTAAPAGADAQWASFWASLTFQLPENAPPASARL